MSTASDAVPEPFDPARLIETHQAGVWRYLRVLGCDPAQADDLTQETFLQVLQRPFRDYNRSATAAYLRRTAHNLYVSFHRRAGRVVTMEEFDQLEVGWRDWVGDDHGEELLKALRECLTKLGERARHALELRFRDQRSRADIADELGLSEDGAKNLLQRAKQRLRQCIDGKLKAR